MTLKYIGVVILASALVIILAGCSSAATEASLPPSTTDEDYVIGSTNNAVPIVLPTYTVPQPADVNPGKIIGSVYVSDKDRLFHRQGCPNLGASSTAVMRQSAIIQGYSACPVCNP